MQLASWDVGTDWWCPEKTKIWKSEHLSRNTCEYVYMRFGKDPSSIYQLNSQGRETECKTRLIHLYFLQIPPLNRLLTHPVELLRITQVKDILSSKKLCKPSKLLLSIKPAFGELDFFGNQINNMDSLHRKMHVSRILYTISGVWDISKIHES